VVVVVDEEEEEVVVVVVVVVDEEEEEEEAWMEDVVFRGAERVGQGRKLTFALQVHTWYGSDGSKDEDVDGRVD